jgi:hypothetical protein
VTIDAAVIVAGLLAAGVMTIRRRRLRQSYGPECGRLAGQSGSRLKAGAGLAGGQRRFEDPGMQLLTDPARAGYAGQRAGIRRFSGTRAEAAAASEVLAAAAMGERGTRRWTGFRFSPIRRPGT